ncbi:FAD:protein FMN transferase [Peptoanaerobacter stomatis]
MKKNKIKILSCMLVSILLFSACGVKKDKGVKEKPGEVSQKQEQQSDEKMLLQDKMFFLNSILTLNIIDEDADKDEIYKKVQERVQELEEKFTINADSSEVSEINQNAGIRPVKVSKDTYYVIKSSIKYSELSGGKFDITVGDLVKLWGIGTDKEKVPSDDEIKSALAKIDYRKIVLDDTAQTVFLQDEGMVIDLGAIAKGYVADEIIKILEENNIKSAIVNLGGNVYVHGSKNGKDFKVGIRDPFSQDANAYFGIYKTQDESIVTSGVYERYFIKNGVRYHHILSTSTGYPIDNELMSTTILTKNSMVADALSTTTFALGVDDGLKLIENTPGVEAIFVTKDKKVYITSGVNKKLELTNKEYEILQ